MDMTTLHESQHMMAAWEELMTSFCPGRNNAFELSAELLFASTSSPASEPLKVADLACGFGGWSHCLHQVAVERGMAINFKALDASAVRLTVCQQVLGEAVTVHPGDLLNTLPQLAQQEERTFDAVLLGWAAHEMPLKDLEHVYRAALQLLKPDGMFLIADFVSHKGSVLQALGSQLTRLRREAFLANPQHREQEKAFHHGHAGGHQHHGQPDDAQRAPRHYEVEAHIQALRQAGFAVNQEVWRHLNSSLIMAINPG